MHEQQSAVSGTTEEKQEGLGHTEASMSKQQIMRFDSY